VVKFSRDGKYLTEWGKRGSGNSEFTLPHNIAIDAHGRVYVTDRENSRIQVFEADGTFVREWPGVGGISALFLTKGQKLWAGDALFDLDGRLLGRLPQPAGGAHGMAMSESGDVYQALLSGRVMKFVNK
jgi:DNA-binding beta-propeller fold protein YncE